MDEDIIKELNEVFAYYSRIWSPALSAEMVHSYAVLKAAKLAAGDRLTPGHPTDQAVLSSGSTT